MSKRRLLASTFVWLFLVPASLGGAPGADSVHAVGSILDAEKLLLEEDLRRFRSLSRRRGESSKEIDLLHRSLEEAVNDREGPDPYRLERILDQVQQAETERQAMLVAERSVVDRVVDRLKRMGLLETRLEDLESRQQAQPVGALTGSWDLVLMPIGLRGSADLEQTGAVVNGTYRFDGGWTGSLQGTLVKRKIFLIRIDSKLGKSMELEGFLSADGTQIRGSWLNYELAGGAGSTGEWSARRSDEP